MLDSNYTPDVSNPNLTDSDKTAIAALVAALKGGTVDNLATFLDSLRSNLGIDGSVARNDLALSSVALLVLSAYFAPSSPDVAGRFNQGALLCNGLAAVI